MRDSLRMYFVVLLCHHTQLRRSFRALVLWPSLRENDVDKRLQERFAGVSSSTLRALQQLRSRLGIEGAAHVPPPFQQPLAQHEPRRAPRRKYRQVV
mgnify:CR=1 FL=1